MMANRARPSKAFIKACKKDFQNRIEGAIRVYCARAETDSYVVILDEILQKFMDSFTNFTYNEEDSIYTVSALATSKITVTRRGEVVKGGAIGGAGGAAAGLAGAGAGGAGIGAVVGIIGGPIGMVAGAVIGGAIGAAVGGAAGAGAGIPLGGWSEARFGRDIRVTWKNIYGFLTDQTDEKDNKSGTLTITFNLDAIGRSS